MGRVQKVQRIMNLVLLLACVAGMVACQMGVVSASDRQGEPAAGMAAQRDGRGLVIDNDSQLPDGYPHRHYELRLHATLSLIHI